MSTYPARRDVITQSVNSILTQVDKLNLCLNNYNEVPEELKNINKLNCIIPKEDYRDVGKFLLNDFDENDDVFYVDDDILYPADYVSKLINYRNLIGDFHPVLGLHGVIYPDVYDGNVQSRLVFTFNKTQIKPRLVNQLGTGTVYCKGYQAPSLSFMYGSQKFVDVRFSSYAFRNNWPLIAVEREENWLREIKTEETIFSTFTGRWPLNVIKECQTISGYSKINKEILAIIE